MFRFFRKIRQRLIVTGSIRSYLLYALGEVTLIVIGVLIAMQVNGMNNFRLNRLNEQRIIVRLSTELDASMQRITLFHRMLTRKQESLEAISPYFHGKPVKDSEAFVNEVIQASRFGWEQPTLERTTFNEILSSGQLSLILDTELRLAITRFYHTVAQRETRSDMRMSEFPRIAYQLIPRETEPRLKEGLDSKQIDAIAQALLKSPIRDQLIAEKNRARFMLSIWQEMQSEASELQIKFNERLRRPNRTLPLPGSDTDSESPEDTDLPDSNRFLF